MTFDIAFYQSNLSTFGTQPKRVPSFAEVENNAKFIVLERPPNYQYMVLCVSADEVGGREDVHFGLYCICERFSGINLPS
jgi:hypothetical protein